MIRRSVGLDAGSDPLALTAMLMSLAMRANCFAMRFQRANMACLRTSKMRPMRAPCEHCRGPDASAARFSGARGYRKVRSGSLGFVLAGQLDGLGSGEPTYQVGGRMRRRMLPAQGAAAGGAAAGARSGAVFGALMPQSQDVARRLGDHG